jgi:hypothetical protein
MARARTLITLLGSSCEHHSRFWATLGAIALGSCTKPSTTPLPASAPPVTYESDTAASAGVSAVASASVSVAGAASVPVQAPVSFAQDLKFLEQQGPVILLESNEHAVVALSAKYQARVMTSAVSRDAQSLGYINRQFITEGKTRLAFDNYGGEERLWLGPEAGQFGLFFPKGKAYELPNWQEPAAIQGGDWAIVAQSSDRVRLTKKMTVENHQGQLFELEVTRSIRILTEREALEHIGSTVGLGSTKWLSYESTNQITNIGQRPWTKARGMVSIWLVSMYRPSADTYVIIPFDVAGTGPLANDRYFGVVPPERLRIDEQKGILTFLCDGLRRSKIGVGPARAKGWIASYSESQTLLTLVKYDPPKGRPDYVNSLWEDQKDPYAGDVINSYNDGPADSAEATPKEFYELETSSPAVALAPHARLTHVQRTVHLMGARSELDPIAKATIGTTLTQLANGT